MAENTEIYFALDGIAVHIVGLLDWYVCRYGLCSLAERTKFKLPVFRNYRPCKVSKRSLAEAQVLCHT